MSSRITKSSGSRQTRSGAQSNIQVPSTRPRGTQARRASRSRSHPTSTRSTHRERAILQAIEDSLEPSHSAFTHQPAELLTEEPTFTDSFTEAPIQLSSYALTSSSPTDALLPAYSIEAASAPYDLDAPLISSNPSNQQLESQDMSALGFLLPVQYGPLSSYETSFHSPSFMMEQLSGAEQQHYQAPTSAPSSSSSSYPPSYAPIPAILGSSPVLGDRRGSQGRTRTGSQPFQPIARSLYEPQQRSLPVGIGSIVYPGASVAPASSSAPASSPPYAAQSPAIPGHGISGPAYSSSYTTSPNAYTPATYDMGYSSIPTGPHLYVPPHGQTYPPAFVPSSRTEGSATASSAAGGQERVISTRPKPQCWDHGCNGRQFSTFSNLLRHQREKSGTAAKSYCPRCGAEFTRTTARNGHMAHDKCKRLGTSEAE